MKQSMRSSSPWWAALLLATANVSATAQTPQTAPPANGGRGANNGADGKQVAKTPLSMQPFAPNKSTWARFSEHKIRADRVEPSETELAARFGLERVGPRALDQVVEYRHPKNGMLFVFIPGGTFRMGSNHGDIYSNRMVLDSGRRGKVDEAYFGQEQPQFEIYVSPFFIGVYEVTNAEYRTFLEEMRAGKVPVECEWPILFGRPDHVPYLQGDPRRAPFDGDRQPIAGISWLDAWAFSSWMGGRLPTEAEWEKTARGTDGRTFPWGNQFDAMRLNVAESQNHKSLAVGTFPGGRSPYGCFDMGGNVSEYCVDAFEETLFRVLPLSNPCLLERYPPRDQRAQRGGNWNRFGLLYKARGSARAWSKMTPAYPDPHKESMDTFPVTEYLYSGMRVCLPTSVDVFPDGAKEQLMAQAKAVRDQRIEALRKKQEATGKREGAPNVPGLPGTVPAPESGTDPDDDGGGGSRRDR